MATIKRQLLGGCVPFLCDAGDSVPVIDPTAFQQQERGLRCRLLFGWIYPVGFTNVAPQSIVAKGKKEDLGRIQLVIAPGDGIGIVFVGADGLEKVRHETVEIPRNKWSHVSVKWSSEAIEVYLNGELQISEAPGVSSHSYAPFDFGSKNMGLLEDFQFVCGDDIDSVSTIQDALKKRPSYPPDSCPSVHTVGHPLHSVKAIEKWTETDPINRPTLALSERKSRPNGIRVIHCHDMRGGYVDDNDPNGYSHHNVYNFRHWQYVDTFIYFSHHRLSIPPIGWVHAAHKNGVEIMGTYITEWDEGEKESIRLLEEDELEYKQCAVEGCEATGKLIYIINKLVQVAEYYKLDGWFLNIENKLTGSLVEKMRVFVRELTKAMKARNPKWSVIWYDSVTHTGELKWQNKLNDSNCSFFDECDGFFANYAWKEEYPVESVSLRPSRCREIYMGIDIFGRGTFGGGGYDAIKALEVIEKSETSVALFAPGWTFESNKGHEGCRLRFEMSEDKFWMGLQWHNLLDRKMSKFESEGWSSHENGGGGWKTIKGSRFGEEMLLTSYEWNKRCIELSLLDIEGFDATLLDEYQPRIVVEDWFKGSGPNFNDLFYVRAELRDENHEAIVTFDTGILTASEAWQNVRKDFHAYGQGVRYIYLEDGGKDVEYWAGHYGTVIDGTSIFVERPYDLCGSIATKIPPRCVPGALPLYTNFSQGIGHSFYRQGKMLQASKWANMLEQNVQPNHDIEAIDGCKRIRTFGPNYNAVFDGGNSWAWVGSFPGNEKYAVLNVFQSHITLQEQDVLLVEYSIPTDNQHELYLLLELSCGEVVHLNKSVVGSRSDALNVALSSLEGAVSTETDVPETHWRVRHFEIPASALKESAISRLAACVYESSHESTSQHSGLTSIGHIYVDTLQGKSGFIPQITNITTKPIWNAASLGKGVHVVDTLIEWHCDARVDYVEIYREDQLIGRSYSYAYMLSCENGSALDSISLCAFGCNRESGVRQSLPKGE